MAISLDSLRDAAKRSSARIIEKSLAEARAKGQPTAFLCHSHYDHEMAVGLQVLLNEHGWDLYIDWQDTQMTETPNQETAQRIQKKIKDLDWFLFLATPNSTSSRWCPWEIGYADSAKPKDSILIIATYDRSGKYYGNEYLQLYREITTSKEGKLAAFPPGMKLDGILIKSL